MPPQRKRSIGSESLRVALLTYRGNPLSGGQGVYVRYLSRALTDIGHKVEVISGPPYPELHDDVLLSRLPSLDLYQSSDPFRRPRLSEFGDAIDVLEYASMCVASFPEPLTFSLRAARELRRRRTEFDVVHDNQGLGYGLLAVHRSGLPVVATIHHPCSIDRDIELAATTDWKRRLSLRRWYSFTKMQARVARRLERIIAVSGSAALDVAREFRVPAERTTVVHNGVDTELFRPVGVQRVPGRILTTSSSDLPLKGLVHLLEAVAKLRTEREDVHLVVIGKKKRKGPIADALRRFDLDGAVTFKHGIDWLELVEEYGRAEVAVVPSVYEGFSLPAVEAMSCGVPLVTTTGGALPEVVGNDAEAALLVPPADAGALALSIGRLLDREDLRCRLGAAGRARVLERFTWAAAARRTAEEYRKVIESC